MRRCYKTEGVMIPGCMARAINENNCTCPPRRSSNADLQDSSNADLRVRLDKLEKNVAALTAALNVKEG